jgi:hypothetical protein
VKGNAEDAGVTVNAGDSGVKGNAGDSGVKGNAENGVPATAAAEIPVDVPATTLPAKPMRVKMGAKKRGRPKGSKNKNKLWFIWMNEDAWYEFMVMRGCLVNQIATSVSWSVCPQVEVLPDAELDQEETAILVVEEFFFLSWKMLISDSCHMPFLPYAINVCVLHVHAV